MFLQVKDLVSERDAYFHGKYLINMGICSPKNQTDIVHKFFKEIKIKKQGDIYLYVTLQSPTNFKLYYSNSHPI